MKNNIHPKWNNEAKVIVNGKEVATVGSTESELVAAIWSGNHPFYTGEEVFVDTDNLVEKFNEKIQKAQSSTASVRSKKEKRSKRLEKKKSELTSSPVTLKDMLKNLQ